MSTPIRTGLPLFLIVGSVLFAGCAAVENADRSTGRFRINGSRGTILDSKALEVVRAAWKSITADLTTQSRLSKANQRWSMDFIANVESEGVSPCRSLELSSVSQLESKPFRGQTPAGKPLVFTPTTYLEQWVVAACGKTRQWRLFEETSDPTNPFRVILWSAG